MLKKSILVIVAILLVVGCSSSNKSGVVSNRKIEGSNGTKDVNEKIILSDNNIEYNFETDDISVVVKNKFDTKKFKYKDGKLTKDHYSISYELIEYDYPMFDEYKDLPGYDKITIDGKEAISTIGVTSEAIMVKINDNTILYIMGNTDGNIVNIEMTNDNDYKLFVNNTKITIKNK